MALPRPAFVFLDFDGVIMDSMRLKLDSYCHAFDGLGFGRDAIRKLQLASAGLSRFKTIPLMYESLAGEPMPEELYQVCLARFTEHDDASRGKMALKAGTAEFLEAAMSWDMPQAIITGTPQEVIDRTVDHFGLRRYFRRVCGAPGSKLQHLERLLGDFRLEPSRCLFVGDAIKDQEAAVAAGVPFIGVNNGDDPFRPEGMVAEVKSLDRILPLFEPV
jgi:phosphoglycolate phosphatase-like HAD superfamily hydrolase